MSDQDNRVGFGVNREWARLGPDGKTLEALNERAIREDAQSHPLAALLDAIIRKVRAERGLTPEMPPRPPEGDGLPRYGLHWNGPSQPLSVPMDDGYWTPWHLADRLQHGPVGLVVPPDLLANFIEYSDVHKDGAREPWEQDKQKLLALLYPKPSATDDELLDAFCSQGSGNKARRRAEALSNAPIGIDSEGGSHD